MTQNADSPIDADIADMIVGGVSISVASCDARLRPSLTRAGGCSIDGVRGELRVLVVRGQCAALLDDLAAGQRVAVVFSDVASHRSLQLKADGARVEPATTEDLLTARRYLDRFAASLDLIGFAYPFTEALLGIDAGEIAALVMRPQALFSQTPGPGAGQRLRRVGSAA